MADQNFTTEELQNEEWRDVVGYETFYQVSNLGRVRSVHPPYPHDPIRKQWANRKGYLSLTLHKHGTTRRAFTHRLVLAAFVGPLPPEHEVNHIDGIKNNNRVNNLEYCTQVENRAHAIRIGLMPYSQTGSNHPRALVSDNDVREIRRLRTEDHVPVALIAKRFGMSTINAYCIISRKSWKHII